MFKRIGKYVSQPEEEEEIEDMTFLNKKRQNEEEKLFQFQRDYNDEASEEEQMPVQILVCTPCSKKLFSEVDFNNHMNSKKHAKVMKSTIRREINEMGFKNFLIKKEFITNHRTNYNKLKYLLYLNSISKIIN